MTDEFNRTDGLFSLCGLNCGLCPMQIRGECSGCFNGSTCYTTCPLAPCSVQHGNVQYCFECTEYPCKRYDGIDRYDSLISHKNQKHDLIKAREMGIDAYLTELLAKRQILLHLLSDYDDGHSDVFFCQAVNMLARDDLETIMKECDRQAGKCSLSERSAVIRQMLRDCADKRGISLTLRRGRY